MNTFSWHGSAGVIHEFNSETDLIPAAEIMAQSIDSLKNCFPMKAVPSTACALPDCAFIDCGEPGYPFQVDFLLTPLSCLANPNFNTDLSNWQQSVGTNVNVLAQDESIGNIIDRIWIITTDPTALFSNEPCDIFSDADTCRLLYWNEPGQKQITLTVTDANACQISYTQNIQIVTPNCALPPINTQIVPTQNTCNLDQSICPNNSNGQIIITPPNNENVYNCYTYYVEYHATDPNVNTAQDLYANSAFIPQSNGRVKLTCLPEGYYKIKLTDEISTCESETIVFIPINSPIDISITKHISVPTFNCHGSITVQKINDNFFDSDLYSFAWSDCSTCNTPFRENLCSGWYNVIVTDLFTGCQGENSIFVPPLCDIGHSNSSGSGVGVVEAIDVYPTVFDNIANVKLKLNYDAEVTIDVYNLYGTPIKKLLDKEIKSAGEYHIQDNASNEADGLYIYTVKACAETKGDIGIKH